MSSLTLWTWVWVDSGSWWWTERPGMLQSMGSQRIGHDWVAELNWKEYETGAWPECPYPSLPVVTHRGHRESYYLPHPKGTWVYNSPISHGLVCYRQSNFKHRLLLTRGSLICYHVNWHGNPLYYSRLENPMDRGAWQAAVCKITKNQTWLKQLGMRKHACTSCLYCTELRWWTLSKTRDARQMILQKTLFPVFLGWWFWWCGPWSEGQWFCLSH